MQAVKDKLNDMKEMRKVKAEAKAEEKAEKDLAKARVDIAHEVRLAREAEATMELHVAKAGHRAEREIAKQLGHQPPPHATDHPYVGAANTNDPYGQDPAHLPGSTTMGMGNPTNTAAGAPPRNNFM